MKKLNNNCVGLVELLLVICIVAFLVAEFLPMYMNSYKQVNQVKQLATNYNGNLNNLVSSADIDYETLNKLTGQYTDQISVLLSDDYITDDEFINTLVDSYSSDIESLIPESYKSGQELLQELTSNYYNNVSSFLDEDFDYELTVKLLSEEYNNQVSLLLTQDSTNLDKLLNDLELGL